jgi:hypothetical protein
MLFAIIITTWLICLLFGFVILMRSALIKAKSHTRTWSSARTLYFFLALGSFTQRSAEFLRSVDGPNTVISEEEISIFRKNQMLLYRRLFILTVVSLPLVMLVLNVVGY